VKARHFIAMAAALSVSSAAIAADDGETLLRKHGCDTCHSVDNKVVGPAFREIAGKYRGDSKALAMLEKKMRKGGSGAWGSMPMPPVAKSVSDENIRTIIKWVLSLK
jgi:cytochrome c